MPLDDDYTVAVCPGCGRRHEIETHTSEYCEGCEPDMEDYPEEPAFEPAQVVEEPESRDGASGHRPEPEPVL